MALERGVLFALVGQDEPADPVALAERATAAHPEDGRAWLLLAESLPAPLVRIGVRDQFGTSGDPDGLVKHYRLSAADIKAAVHEAIKKKR